MLLTTFIFKVVIGDDTGLIQAYNDNKILIYTFEAHSSTISQLKALPNGCLASSSWDSTVKIWNHSNWHLISTYSGHNDDVWGLEYINNDTMASSSFDSTIHIWSINNGRQIKKIIARYNVFALCVLGDGLLASGEDYGHITIWNISTSNTVYTLKKHLRYVNDLALVSDQVLASASADKTIIIWNLTTSSKIYILIKHDDEVTALKVISSSILASASLDNTINIWCINNGSLLQTLVGHNDYILHSLDLFKYDILISGSFDKTILFWQVSSRHQIEYILTAYNIYSLAVIERKSVENHDSGLIFDSECKLK